MSAFFRFSWGKKMKKVLSILSVSLMSFIASAEVTIQTDSRVEILAVNQEINAVANRGAGDLKIKDGENQLLLRVTALVDGNGGKRKFNSLPMVIKFTAQDETLKLETPFAIRDERAVRAFEKSPSVKVTSNGHALDMETDIIFDQTFALIKDYDAMLAGYNKAGGVAAISPKSMTVVSTPVEVAQAPTVAKAIDEKVSLKADFLSMSPEQRQEFISWAVKHIND